MRRGPPARTNLDESWSLAMNTAESATTRIPALLRGLRGAVRRWLWLAGVAVCLQAVAAWILLSFGLDWLLEMDRVQRSILLVLAGAGLAGISWRRLWRPLAHPLTDEALALRLESARPELGGRLIAALQLATRGAGAGVSGAMTTATIEAGSEAARGLSWRDLIDTRRLRALALRAGLGLLLVGTLAAAATPAFALWFERNVLLREIPWPKDTRLTVLDLRDGALAVPHGDALTVRIEADGVVPARVMVDAVPEGGGERRTEAATRLGERGFRVAFPAVREDFQLRARGGDGRTTWIPVRVLPRPELRALTLTATPPAYTKLEPTTLPPERDAHALLEGSALRLTGTATKPLKRVTCTIGETSVALVRPGGATDFAIDLDAETLRGGVLALHWTDSDGIPAAEPARLRLRIIPDRAPTVRLRLEGVGDRITAKARIPMAARLRDDHGLTAVAFEFTAEKEGQTLTAPPALRETLPGAPRATPEATLDLQAADLPEGTRLAIVAAATDNRLGPDRAPQTTRSAPVALRVVSPEELREALIRREQESAVTFKVAVRDGGRILQAARLQRAALPRAEAGADGTEAAPAVRKALRRLERDLRRLGPRIERTEARFADLRAQWINNRLEPENGATPTRMAEEILGPLAEARGALLPAANEAVDRAAEAGLPAHAVAARLAEAEPKLTRLVQRLEAVERAMLQWETYQEAIRLLREILQQQDKINQETKRAAEAGVEELFD